MSSSAGQSSGPIGLFPQTGMPPVYHKRSQELIYDTLQNEVKFAMNPFGPQLLVLSRANHCWAGAGPTTTPPRQASAAGFSKLIFNDDFNSLDVGFGVAGHRWNAGLWWETVPPSSDFSISNSVLTITATATTGTNLCTQHYDSPSNTASGTQFLGGYYEALVYCTDWSAFWLNNWKEAFGAPIVSTDPLSWVSEIDIIESDPGPTFSNLAFVTMHKNTGGSGGVPDEGNQGNTDKYPMPGGANTVGEWHIYGVLWTQSAVTFYVDNIQLASFAPYPSTWQPCQLILSAQPGGVSQVSQSTVIPPITMVDWVRVWS